MFTPPPRKPQAVSLWSIPDNFKRVIIRKRVRHFAPKLLALTFDDGPNPDVTPVVLSVLAEFNAHATFFVEGCYAEKHPELLREIEAAGHAIGNHTFTHAKDVTPAQAEHELVSTENAIKKATGHRPTLFRPPYGITKGALTEAAKRRGYAVVLWTISSADTRPIDADTIANNIIHTPNSGDIVIMHDGPGHGFTAEALPKVLKELSEAGFQFVTVPELLRAWDTHRAMAAK